MTAIDQTTGAAYRIEHPSMLDVMRDLRIPATDPGPGDQMPSFDLPTISGGRFASEQFDGTGQPTLVVFGSLTCPITESAGEGLVRLHRRYGSSVRFVLVDVREAHPGASAPQPIDPVDKVRHAEQLAAHHQLPFEVAVDDVDGSLHRAVGTRPSSAYLVDPDGTIVFRAHWSNLTDDLDEALAAVTEGRAVPNSTVGGTFRSMAKMTGYAPVAFDNAGPGAMADTWRAAAPFAAMITASTLFAFLPPERRGVPAMAALAAALGVVVAVLVVVT